MEQQQQQRRRRQQQQQQQNIHQEVPTSDTVEMIKRPKGTNGSSQSKAQTNSVHNLTSTKQRLTLQGHALKLN